VRTVEAMVSELRELLFGDVPLHEWAGSGSERPEPPWTLFQTAARAIDAGDTAAAETAMRAVLAAPGLESRQLLQAWTTLRSIGVKPDDGERGRVVGVVLDVPLEQGADVLAAYADHSARYLNQGGGAIVWDVRDPTMDALVDAVLDAARPLLALAGVWDGDRPPLPHGLARVSLLTPVGLHFGQAGFAQLLQDPHTEPVFQAGAALMSALIERSTGHR
jgi:hypothetical protein